MFELLLLASLALIVFSQELPMQQQKSQEDCPDDLPLPAERGKHKQKKQPRRNQFEGAA